VATAATSVPASSQKQLVDVTRNTTVEQVEVIRKRVEMVGGLRVQVFSMDRIGRRVLEVEVAGTRAEMDKSRQVGRARSCQAGQSKSSSRARMVAMNIGAAVVTFGAMGKSSGMIIVSGKNI